KPNPISNSLRLVKSGAFKSPGWRATVDRLPPGKYELFLRTIPTDPSFKSSGDSTHPGHFHTRQTVELQAGRTTSVPFKPQPLDVNASRGDRSVRLKIASRDGAALAGKTVQISHLIRNYGKIPVYEGKLDGDTTVSLNHLRESVDLYDA